MKVSQIPYERVSLEEIEKALPEIVNAVRNAGSADEILKARESYRTLLERFETSASLASMRYTINTADPFYVAENEYYDEISPRVQALDQEYIKAMMASPFRPELEEKLGYVFSDRALLERALTHSSCANERRINKKEDYERLEFLGDAVLELTVSEFLYNNYPQKKEGEMTRTRAALVCKGAGAAFFFDARQGRGYDRWP